MAWWIWVIIAVYVLGFVGAFWFNASLGMITLGLTLLRAFLWPLWIVGLIPGEPQQMD
jgi:hypothetical protein